MKKLEEEEEGRGGTGESRWVEGRDEETGGIRGGQRGGGRRKMRKRRKRRRRKKRKKHMT